MKRLILAGTVALLPVAVARAQFTVAPAPNLCRSYCDPQPPIYPSGPLPPVPQPYYPPVGYGIATPPHDPAFDAGPQVVCDGVACVEY